MLDAFSDKLLAAAEGTERHSEARYRHWVEELSRIARSTALFPHDLEVQRKLAVARGRLDAVGELLDAPPEQHLRGGQWRQLGLIPHRRQQHGIRRGDALAARQGPDREPTHSVQQWAQELGSMWDEEDNNGEDSDMSVA